MKNMVCFPHMSTYYPKLYEQIAQMSNGLSIRKWLKGAHVSGVREGYVTKIRLTAGLEPVAPSSRALVPTLPPGHLTLIARHFHPFQSTPAYVRLLETPPEHRSREHL